MYPQPATHAIRVKHTFEAAHRLPQLGGKCVSLHGHSWSVLVTIAAPGLGSTGTVAEFGELKSGLRRWIDTNLDHASMLGADDPLASMLAVSENKVFCFGVTETEGAETLASDLPWPTVESIAVVLSRVAEQVLGQLTRENVARVARVEVRETHLNTAVYEPWTSW